ncbi:MAG: transposase [Alphaproteobacteria bacterium]|nr:transposase [Alphaproteobacteria bacterium]
MIRKVCSVNYVDTISENVSPDHVHMLLLVPSHFVVSKVIRYTKGRSSRKL